MKKIENNKILLTIFTPAYNRAHTLPRTYQSLKIQDCKDFIWLIVDDGSEDNTAELVSQWQQKESEFEIRYVRKENGGMHTAHNVAYENIDTELNICIDSDDELAFGAVRKILEKWKETSNLGYAGIIGLDADMNTGSIIGGHFPAELKETTVAGYYSAGGVGDKKLVYRTDIINEMPPYPVFEGEKYVSLSYKYRLIDQKYKMAVLDEALCNVEYQAEGSSNNMYRQYLQNPNGFAFWRKVRMETADSKKRMLIDCIHYCSSSQISNNRNYIRESPKKLLTIFCTPAGWMLTAYIQREVKKINHGWDQEKN